MLDTHARKYADPLIDRAAGFMLRAGLSPNQVTGGAFALGIGSGICLTAGFTKTAVGLLWLSGFLDAVDGAMARQSKRTSPFGTLLDITFDRLVEIFIFLGLGFLYPEARLALLFLTSAVILSLTVFLTVGALSQSNGNKSFYYQAGLAERTEGFLFSSVMMLFPGILSPVTLLYALAVLITAGQRFFEARHLLADDFVHRKNR